MSMKKTIILITLCLVAFCCPVQAQHLKFMGIPLNGTITQFQQKLTAKGVKYDKAASQQMPSGVRYFKGTFAGEKANILIYYDPSSKIVYKAKAVMGYPTASSCDTKYEDLKSLLSAKYADAETETDYQDGHESFYYRVNDNGNLGVICIYVSNNIFAYPYEYEVNIEYVDFANYLMNDFSKMEDL